MSQEKIQVVLTNRKARLCRPYPYAELNDVLKYRKPGWEYTPGGKVFIEWAAKEKKRLAEGQPPSPPEGWDGYLHLLKYDTMGAGVFLALREEMEREAMARFVVKDVRHPPTFRQVEKDSRLRGYQEDCVNKMVEASLTGGLILNATGTGKTFIAGSYLRRLVGNAVFLVDELTLLKQARGELEKVLGEEVGEIGNSVFSPKRITAATIQTIHRHRLDERYVPWTRTLQVIFIDELHLALNRRNFQTIAVIQPPVIFGLTATLELKKRNVYMRAYDLAGPVVFEYPLEQGVREGFLSKGIAVAVQVNQDVKAERIRGNPRWRWVRDRYRRQYQELYRDIIVNGKKRNAVIAALTKEARKRGKYVIMLLERVQHLKDMSQRMGDVPHDLVFGEKKVEQRVESKAKFEAGRLRVLLANKVFKKGIDIKRLDVIIDGAGMKSRNDAVQKYGRGVRLADGKVGLIYFDIADVGNRFEKAAKSRRTALKKLGIPVYKVDAELGAEKILDLAEKKLRKLVGD